MLKKIFKRRFHGEVLFHGTALKSAVFALCLIGALAPSNVTGAAQIKESSQAHVIFCKENPLSPEGKQKAASLTDFAAAFIKIRQERKPVFSDEAVKLLMDSVTRNPYAIPPLKLLVANWVKQQKIDEMLKFFLPLAKKYPDAVRLNILTCDTLLRKDKAKEARELLENAVKAVDFKTSEKVSEDMLGELIAKLSSIYRKQDDADAGEELWDDALENKELSGQFITRLAAADFFAQYADKGPDGFFAGWSKRRYRGKLEKNLLALEKIWHDSKISNALLLAPILKIYKRYDMAYRAEKILLQTLLNNPNNSSAMLMLAQTYSDFKRYSDAVRTWQVLIDSDRYKKATVIWRFLTRGRGDDGDFYMELAKAALRAGDLEEAVRAFDWFLLLHPEDPEALFQLGITYMRLNQFTKAILKLEQVKSLPEADFYRSRCYSIQRRYEKALESLYDAQKTAKKYNRADFLDNHYWLEYAFVADQAGEFKKAEDVLKKLIKETPDDPMLNNFLGYLWTEKGVKLDDAKVLIDKALAKDSASAAYLDSLAWVLFKKKQYEGAMANIIKALKYEGEIPDAVIADHAGDIYNALGDKKNALKYWKMALEIYSEDINRGTIKNKIDQLRNSQFEKL